ncbi:Uncharacterized protein YHR202W [Ceratocystis fimbriata CBS 114723]|uniref:Uncharacterized protein YHR202W n=1 Tax=Ceratocystis fimbriata CBS 114723 TaxID=1035309 RepID=A0A2C5X174_9PEZI|nr:Uncharacterized protein YHR202W [Ceratocystis fimbriata CBS 114723]
MRSILARTSLSLWGSWSLYGTACAIQPDAAKPVQAPMRDLTWGQLNFLHTTDTHGWLGGHVSEHQYSADWGDYVSFAHHMRQKADDQGVDLLLVDTGDRVEGNGLYDGSVPKGQYTYNIYRQQDVDLICTGNHELYQRQTAENEYEIQVPNFSDRYVASNLDYIDSDTGKRQPFAQRYRRFKTKNRGIDVVAFGFIFDFTGNQNNTVVQRVEDTIKEEWFQDAIRLRPDIFVVVGHIGLRMPELKAIYTAIRQQNWHIPIVFFAGHAHVRDATSFDSKAYAIASGRYFETVGWMSIDGLQKADPKPKTEPEAGSGIEIDLLSTAFTRRYLDNNLFGYYYHSGLNESTFHTEKGLATTQLIYKARKDLGLDKKLGCAPKSLWMSRVPYPHNNSIYSWLANESLPGIFYNAERANKPRIGLLNTGGVRFDIIRGKFSYDSLFNVTPFTNKIVYIQDVPYAIAKKILAIINSSGPVLTTTAAVQDVRYMGPPEVWAGKDLGIGNAAATSHVVAAADQGSTGNAAAAAGQVPLAASQKPSGDLSAGYTTKDDLGNDGDDTKHAPIAYYSSPNCIQSTSGFNDTDDAAEPNIVDVVFIDFLKPWVLAATKFAGGDYTENDVKLYSKDTFSESFGKWVSENWKGDC